MPKEVCPLDRRLAIASALYHLVSGIKADGIAELGRNCWARTIPGWGYLEWNKIEEHPYTSFLWGTLRWLVPYMSDVRLVLHVYHDLQVAHVQQWSPLNQEHRAIVSPKERALSVQKNFDLLLLEWLRQSIPGKQEV